MRKQWSLQQMVLERKMGMHMQKNKIRPLSLTTDKNQVAGDAAQQTSQCTRGPEFEPRHTRISSKWTRLRRKTWICEATRKIHRRNSLGHGTHWTEYRGQTVQDMGLIGLDTQGKQFRTWSSLDWIQRANS